MDCNDATVFVIEDDEGLRESLQMAMESAGLRNQTFASAEAFLETYTGDEHGCIILDLRLTGMSGLELMEVLRARQQEIPVIMVTGHGDIPAAVYSMKLGAVDFLEKPVDYEALLAKVHSAIGHSAKRIEEQAKVEAAQARLASLTAREKELLAALACGKSSKQIAAELGLSLKTVGNHRSHLLAKTGAESSTALVRMALIAGLA